MNLKIMKKSLVLLFIFSFVLAQSTIPLGNVVDPETQTSEGSPSASAEIGLNQTSEGSTESAEIRLNQTSERSPSASEVIRVNQISEGN